MKRNKKYGGFPLLFAMLLAGLVLVLSGCSVVFTGSLSGEVHDRERYEADQTNSPLGSVMVYLYTEEQSWTADLAAWAGGTGPLPEAAAEPGYFQKTVSDRNGGFTFNGLVWDTLFPKFGKTADRRQVYFLFYHRTYGLTSNTEPIYIVSDVTNIPSPFLLNRIMNLATVEGNVLDREGDPGNEGLENATVNIWVPNVWTYNASGDITGLNETEIEGRPVWNENPTYSLTTDAEGYYRREISFPMMPSGIDNRKTVLVRLTFSRTGYVAENAADPSITDSGWDPDKDGEDNPYYESAVIRAEEVTVMEDISLTREMNSASLYGRVIDTSSGAGVENVTVDIYMPTDWGYTGGGDIDKNTLEWRTRPSYSVTTGADGRFNASVEFERRPGRADNRGTVLARITFTKRQYLINAEADGALTENTGADSWDPDGRPATENPDYLELNPLSDGESLDLPSLSIKRTEFTETLTGRVTSSGIGINGLKVRVDMEQDGTYDYETSTRPILMGDTIVDGYFEFSGLTWTDTDYTGKQSNRAIHIEVESTPPISDHPFNLVSDGNNYVALEY